MLLNLKKALAQDIRDGVAAAIEAKKLDGIDLEALTVVVNNSTDPEHGDYASPVALSLAKEAKQSALDIVAIIADHMPKQEYTGSIEVAAPGFLNIRLNPGWMTARLDDVIQDELCGATPETSGKTVNLEFISANPTGPMTMGNARTAFTADTLANVLSCAGYAVTREYYVNDAGGQIERLGQSVMRRILEAQGETVVFPEDLYQGEYIQEVASTVAEALRENEGKEIEPSDLDDAEAVGVVSRMAVEILQTQNEHIAKKDLRISFDKFSSEQALRDSGVVEEVLKQLDAAGGTYDKDGATWLKTSEHGMEQDNVIVKEDGAYTYLAPDIAYNQDKYEREYDIIFTFLGADHLDYPPRIIAAMEILGNETGRWEYIIAQMFRLVRDGKPVKLSKRAGVVEQPADLIADVGYDAARFTFLLHALSSHMDFDLDVAKEQSERNPVYYVQYAHVRLQSILRRAKQDGVIDDTGESIELTSHGSLTHTMELALMRQLYLFPEIISEIAQTYDVHKLAYYATELARAIHSFYRHVPVIQAEDPKITQSRLQLVLAARKVLRQTLTLLGVSATDVM